MYFLLLNIISYCVLKIIDVVGRQRFKVLSIVQDEPYIIAQVECGVEDTDIPDSLSVEDLSNQILNLEKEVYQLVVDNVALTAR